MQKLFARASRLIPGGVNSPVRSFAGAGAAKPLFIRAAKGATLTDTDGRQYIDLIHGWGAIAAGHSHPQVVAALEKTAHNGLCFGLCSEIEIEHASALCDIAGVDMVRATCSGSEAAMSALRVARGYTGRELVAKFAGCYHGHADGMLVAAGSGSLTFGRPSSAGVTAGAARDTLVLPYNDPQAVRDAGAAFGERLAAVIFEPIAGNMNLVKPSRAFVAELRALCDRHGAVLIADEVMSGMRASRGLACREVYGIEPDLICMGKIIGGGLPAAAVGGRKEIMGKFAPLGPVYQAGTLAGSPPALAAGLAQMRLLREPGAWDRMAAAARGVSAAFRSAAAEHSVPFCAAHAGGMAGLYCASKVPENLAQVHGCDTDMFRALHAALIERGVLLPPSPFEACFVGLAHDAQIVAKISNAARGAFASLAGS